MKGKVEGQSREIEQREQIALAKIVDFFIGSIGRRIVDDELRGCKKRDEMRGTTIMAVSFSFVGMSRRDSVMDSVAG
ncbi:DUF4408 domain-containing protein [Psidium guajava]|nr:DUF4408 domain-containing protein [Psidium guajava]